MTQAFQGTRRQSDNLGDEISKQTAYRNTGPELTRQEFKDEANLNILLARFGVNQQVRQNANFTEVDYNLDLQTALGAIDAARRANMKVPEELRAKYPNWLAVLEGAETGEYGKDLQDLATRKETEKKAEASAPPKVTP